MRPFDISPSILLTQLRCNNGGGKKAALSIVATTDVRGYFKIQTTKATSAMARNCRLFLVSSPFQGCNMPVYPEGEGAAAGFLLKFEMNAIAGGAADKLSDLCRRVLRVRSGRRCFMPPRPPLITEALLHWPGAVTE
uniref:Uncharacterized protein n=1 Tax=Ananas comosus var. bracteatus TaxID=296719 RepID=A0A6V7PP36_ANACO|nr:unnamed protein product [Ananas comosus var. bracteatus]